MIRAPAGMGKTHLLAEEIAKNLGDGRAEVYVPTHALALEWKAVLRSYDPKLWVVVIAGRNHAQTGQKPLCKRDALAAEITRAGQSVYQRLCKSSTGETCEHYQRCSYIDQFRSAGVFIYTHAYLPLDRGMLDAYVPKIVVIDESFFLACIDTIKLHIDMLTIPGIPTTAQTLCSDVSLALRTGTSLWARMVETRKRGGGLSTALEDLRKCAPMPRPGQSDAGVRHVLQSGPNLEPVARLLEHLSLALRLKHDCQSVDYDAATGVIKAHHRRDITRFNVTASQTPPKIFIIDATASREVVETFFPGSHYASYRAKRNAHVIQCRSSRGSTSSLVATKHTDQGRAADAARRLADIQHLIHELSAGGQKLLVVGPTAITGNPRKGKTALVVVPAHCELAHFNAVRGVDSWKTFDAVLVIGRNEPPVKAVEDVARALFYDHAVPLTLSGQWGSEVRGYSLKAGTEGVDVDVHPDARVQAVLDQVRENESIQAIDRLRLIHNTDRKLVYILSNVPLDIDVDELRSWDEFMYGTRLERAWRVSNGLLPLSPPWLSSHFPDLWPTAEGAKQDIQKERKKCESTNSISIGIFTPFEFEYKASGQRRWSRCLSRHNGPAAVKVALDTLIGQKIMLRSPPPAPPQ